MKKTTIKVEKTVKYVEKEELIALGYHECSDGDMSKDYPSGESLNEIGFVIFDKLPDNEGYWRDSELMTLFSYQMKDDPKEFSKRMKKAIDEYRSDMMKLGLLEEKK